MAKRSAERVREHSFDGIQEFDNRLPNWWLWILYGAVVFSVGYWLVFHTVSFFPLPEERYAADVKAAEQTQLVRAAAGGVTDESLELMAVTPEEVAAGKEVFATYCVVCHADRGQGLVGPNLTDAYWLHGGRPMDLHKVVTEGVAAKGMAAWGNQLGPARVNRVVAFLLTIRNTNVSGKAPEGDLYVAESGAKE